MYLMAVSIWDKLCNLGGHGPGPNPVPEFDGPAGIAAAALLIAVAAVLYDKAKK